MIPPWATTNGRPLLVFAACLLLVATGSLIGAVAIVAFDTDKALYELLSP